MRLHVVGCSPAWPNPGGAQSGYLVEHEEGRLLLDCGPGVLARLREREAWPRVDAIVISHFHLDHWGDLMPWALGALFGPGRGIEPPALWLPPGGAQHVRGLGPALHTSAVSELFRIEEYAAGTPFTAAGFELVAHPVRHYDTECYGLRVTGGDKTLAYSSDSALCDALVELARDADVFLCEATRDTPETAARGHLTEVEAVAIAEDARARRLLVVHRPDELPLPDGVERAHDGLIIEV